NDPLPPWFVRLHAVEVTPPVPVDPPEPDPPLPVDPPEPVLPPLAPPLPVDPPEAELPPLPVVPPLATEPPLPVVPPDAEPPAPFTPPVAFVPPAPVVPPVPEVTSWTHSSRLVAQTRPLLQPPLSQGQSAVPGVQLPSADLLPQEETHISALAKRKERTFGYFE